jgi:hypothetical protein
LYINRLAALSTDESEGQASMELTIESIKADVAGFNKRIEDARSKILSLPSNVTGWPQKKKIGAERNRLMTEIDHVKRIRQYALDALEYLN